MAEEIVLEKNQLFVALKNCYDLHRYGKVLNTSNVGKGKSIMLSWVLKMMQVRNAIMICTSSLVPTWEDYKEKYDLPFVTIISYETLRGTQIRKKDIRLKHGLLIRKANGSFEVTDYYKQLVEDGLVLCADESQKFKTCCDIQKAMKALSSYLQHRRKMSPKPTYLCGYYYNSTTPFDKQGQLINFCYTSGIITNPELMSKENDTMLGLKELYDYCLEIDRVKTETIIGTMAVRYRNAENIAYQLCIEVFIPTISAFVGKKYDFESTVEYLVNNLDFDLDSIVFSEDYEDENMGGKQTIYNTYCKVNGIALQILKLGNYMISPSTYAPVPITQEMDELYSQIIQGPSPLKDRLGITHGQITKHTIKTYFNICRMARHYLNAVPDSKIVIFLDYKESINVAARELEEFGVLLVTGDNDKEEREVLRRKFQEPNTEFRVKITMNQLSSVGVEYDDKYGDFPRSGFGIKGYNISNPIQCPGRICRKNTRSNSLFFYIGIDDDDEDIDESVDRNIEEKSRIFRESLKDNGVVPPDCFVDLYYDENIDFNDLLANAGNAKYKSKHKEVIKNKPLVIRRTTIVKDVI